LSPPQRNGCLTALIGVILLLPGLCALIFAAGSIPLASFDSGFVPIVLSLIAAALGVLLIRAAIRGPEP